MFQWGTGFSEIPTLSSSVRLKNGVVAKAHSEPRKN